jgi:parallel beta-helix repeat protein
MTHCTMIGARCLHAVLLGLALTSCSSPDQLDAPAPAAVPPMKTADGLPDIAAKHTALVAPGMSLQAAVNAVGAGGIVLIQPGVYRDSVVVTAPGVRLQGLDGGNGEGVVIENPGGADNGVHVTATARDFVLENVTVRGFEENGVLLVGVDGFRLARVRTERNGEYGLFPVRSAHGVIENCTATGHADTAIYVGESSDVEIRTSVASANVAGFEIENSTRVSLTQSRSFDNTIGILVSLLPGLPVMTSGDILVARDQVENNNRPNFGNPEDIVALLPSGSGIIVIGPDRVTVSNNTVTSNHSTGIALGSALILTQLAGLPPDVFAGTDPTPDHARIEFNEAIGNGTAPLPPFGSLFPGVDLLWDGLGTGNCWRQNRYETSFPAELPACP